jgi:hypothetical protein
MAAAGIGALTMPLTSLREYIDYDGSAASLLTANRVDAAWLNAVDAALQGRMLNLQGVEAFASAATAADRSAAAQTALDAFSAAGGGIVLLGTGSFTITTIDIPSNVILAGAGIGRTVLVGTASTAQQRMIGFVSSTTGSGLIGVTLTGPTTGTTVVPLYIEASITACLFRDIAITGGVFSAILINIDCTDNVFENIDVSGTVLSAGLGASVWLFDGAVRNRFRGLRIRNVQGSGLALDASSASGDSPVSENTFEDIYIENANSVSGSASLMLQGASKNQFRGVRIKGGGAAAISCSTDQASGLGTVLGSDDNTFEGVSIEDPAGIVFYCLGSSRNRLRGKVYNPTRAAGGRPIRFEAITVNAVAFPAEYNIVELDMVTVNSYINPAEFVATATVEVRDNLIRYSKPFAVDFNAVSVAEAARVLRNIVDCGLLYGTATWNPGSIADAAQETTTVTVTGAVLGDVVDGVSFSLSLQNMTMTAYVSAADTVTVVLQNESGGAVDLASGTLRVAVRRYVN